MNTKDRLLLQMLLKHDRPVTSQELADYVGVSPRTIKRMTSEINEELQPQGAHVSSGSAGYNLIQDDPALFDVFWNKMEAYAREFSIDDPITLAIIRKLMTKAYVRQEELIDDLFISRSTLSKYVRKVKEVFEPEGILLSNRPYYGYYLAASETVIRNYMVRLFFHESIRMENSALMESCRSPQIFLEQVDKVLIQAGLWPQDAKGEAIKKYLIVSSSRLLCGSSIVERHETPMLTQQAWDTAKQLAQLIQIYYPILVPQTEIQYMALLIGNPLEKDQPLLEEQLEIITDQFFEKIKDVYQIDFSQDLELRKSLIQHLYTSYTRLSVNAVISNPLIELIKTRYVEAYNYAILCGEVLRDEAGISAGEDSLGYIAIHFAAAMERQKRGAQYKVVVVCSSGFGMAQLLKERLSSRLPNLIIADVLSASELETYDLSDILLVISSVRLSKRPEKPVLLVDPLLTDGDVEAIQGYLAEFGKMSKYRILFSRDRFYPHCKAETPQQALSDLADKLVQEHWLSPREAQAVLDREMISSTELNPLTAVPHCILEGEKDTVFAVEILEHPIHWNKRDVQIVFLGMIGTHSNINRKVFPLLYKLTLDTEKMERLAQKDDFDSFMNLLFSNIPVSYD